ncbi:MAG: type II secretion system protein [Candidatus Moranbacteria bacterium]|jgi:prepilin-type N-terminal cleavage/methylation domain-containing protein|nr:type II secretion system protein [Candidatus Moranbacteria bacterium]
MAINNKKINNKKGFTLVEVVVAIGMFVIIIAASSGIFARLFKSYRGAKNVNENMKNAQFALNLMSKTFRTSSVKYYIAGGGNIIVVYDYSQSSCIRYVFNGTALTKANTTIAVTESNCHNGASFVSPAIVMTSGAVTGSFYARDSRGNDSNNSSTRVGLVTVNMRITSGGAVDTGSSARIQSTSSLRDYTVSNVGIDPNNAP